MRLQPHVLPLSTLVMMSAVAIISAGPVFTLTLDFRNTNTLSLLPLIAMVVWRRPCK